MPRTPTNPRPRASIIEIARAAEVSPATVSRAFNHPGLVQRDTLERIEAVAKQHGFRPSRIGRSLRSGNTHTIGLILPTLSNPVFAECLQGAEHAAREQGYSVMVATTQYDPDIEWRAAQQLIDHRVEGLILTVANAARSAALGELQRMGMPYMLAYNEANGHPFVSVDNRAAATEIIELLAQRGHRQIAMVSGPLRASDRARARLNGARSAARALGLPPIQHLELPAHTASDATCLKTLLHATGRPTALFCSNDLLAASVIADLRAMKLRVPQDISVYGFDGMAFGALMTPPLSSARQPNLDIGAQACTRLLAALSEGRPVPVEPLRLPYQITLGGTIGRPPTLTSSTRTSS